MGKHPVREGYSTPTPYLSVNDGARAIDFYERAFGARVRSRIEAPNGAIGHAELEIGDSLIMLCDGLPHFAHRPPSELGGTSVGIFVYFDDVDAAVGRAVEAGATVTTEAADLVWGDRFGVVTDPFGHVWLMATHVEDLAPEEITARGKAAMSPNS